MNTRLMNDQQIHEAKLDMLGIFRHNTLETDYETYLRTLAENEMRRQDCSEQNPRIKNLLRLKNNDVCNHIMPFVSPNSPDRTARNTLIEENGHKIHPMTMALNMDLYEHPDDIEKPFVSGIHAKQCEGDMWPCSFMLYTVSIEHHVANFEGKAAPIGWWTECVRVNIDPADAALLTSGYVLGQDFWSKYATNETAIAYLTKIAEKRHHLFPAIYRTRQILLSQAIAAKGSDECAVNECLDMSVFQLQYDIEEPRITAITVMPDRIQVTIRHLFGTTNDYEYKEIITL